MKRGMVLLDSDEASVQELKGRVIRLQKSLQQQGIDLALIYGDVYHSSDISYLSNICIYWNEGMLAVPATGDPAFLTKLSPRVQPWMRAFSILKDLRSGPNFAALVSQFVEDKPAGKIGLVEMDWWPASVIEQLQEKLPNWKFQDIGQIVKQVRQNPSDSEIKFLEASAGISEKAIDFPDASLTTHERAGKAELIARMSGVEDVFVYSYPTTDKADTIEVYSEYRGYWTAASRIISKAEPDWMPMMAEAYEAMRKTLTAGVDLGKLRAAASKVLDGKEIFWEADLIHHTDLETQGDYRLPGEESHPVQEGSVVALRLVFTIADGNQAVLTDTFLILKNGATCLTKSFQNKSQSI
jgi:hypothetical protein